MTLEGIAQLANNGIQDISETVTKKWISKPLIHRDGSESQIRTGDQRIMIPLL
jgi:hypothetical protein